MLIFHNYFQEFIRLQLLGACAYNFQRNNFKIYFVSTCAYKLLLGIIVGKVVIHGHYIYKAIWMPEIGETLHCEQE